MLCSATSIQLNHKLILNADILNSVAGVNSNIVEWKAAELENSPQTKLMAARFEDINNDFAANAYGYGLIQELFVYPVHEINNGIVGTPLICQQPIPNTSGTKRCVFVYENGLLVGYQNDLSILPSIGLNSPLDDGDVAEVFQGIVSATDGVIYDTPVITSEDLKHFGFRCYVCPVVSGQPSYDWEDVTDTNFCQFDEATATLTWNSSLLSNGFFPAVKIGNTVQLFVKNDYDLVTYDGHLKFTVGDGIHSQIPPGQINVYSNGRPLVYGIDFVVNWPEICVVRVPSETIDNLEIMVRTMGWCNPETMQPWEVETGWVRDGKISFDGRRSVRTNRSAMVVSNELYYPQESIDYAENSTSVAPLVDGKPYAIYDYVCAVDALTDQSTMDLLIREREFSDRVSDYLTSKIGEPAPVDPVIIGSRWQLFSPVVSTLIHSLNAGYLDSGELDSQYTNLDVDLWMDPFKMLLPFDPAFLKFDDQYVDVRAHQYSTAMELTNSQYRFVEYVIKHYLFDRIDLTSTVLNLG